MFAYPLPSRHWLACVCPPQENFLAVPPRDKLPAVWHPRNGRHRLGVALKVPDEFPLWTESPKIVSKASSKAEGLPKM